MKFEKLQFITDSPHLAEEACAAGVRWIQGRVKKKSPQETKSILSHIAYVCKNFNCTFIVNDYVDLAMELNADGVHLGKNDLDVSAAKKIIGSKKFILGGTANTLEDVIRLADLKVDYIGLGPLRFTTTKDKLSPVLGFEGYQNILSSARNQKINLPPVYAIGGIVTDDVQSLVQAGIYGVAVSGVIASSVSKPETIDQFYHQFNSLFHVN
jgi:thiamine-phosphate pyrophosphorylase